MMYELNDLVNTAIELGRIYAYTEEVQRGSKPRTQAYTCAIDQKYYLENKIEKLTKQLNNKLLGLKNNG